MRLLLLETPFRPFPRRLHVMPEPVEFGVDLGNALGLASEQELVALAEQRLDLGSAFSLELVLTPRTLEVGHRRQLHGAIATERRQFGLHFGRPLGAARAHVAVALPAKRLDLRRAVQLLIPLLEQAKFRSHTVDATKDE